LAPSSLGSFFCKALTWPTAPPLVWRIQRFRVATPAEPKVPWQVATTLTAPNGSVNVWIRRNAATIVGLRTVWNSLRSFASLKSFPGESRVSSCCVILCRPILECFRHKCLLTIMSPISYFVPQAFRRLSIRLYMRRIERVHVQLLGYPRHDHCYWFWRCLRGNLLSKGEVEYD
jgi:hypothetical protein